MYSGINNLLLGTYHLSNLNYFIKYSVIIAISTITALVICVNEVIELGI